MSLVAIIDAIRRREKRLTVFDPPSRSLVDDLAAYFEAYPVVVVEGTATNGPDGFAVLSDGDRALVTIDHESIEASLYGGRSNPKFEKLVENIDGATFASYDKRQLRATSEEIEDRAWRAGTGTLHAGFRTIEAIAARRRSYEQLATKQLDIHIYAAPDGVYSSDPVYDPTPASTVDGITVHRISAAEIAETWFVVYDGDGLDENKCALLAEEREPDLYSGIWTYEPELVDRVLSYLSGTYLTA